MIDSRCTSAFLILMMIGVPTPTFAAHPLQTEDSGTQGIGNLELENGFARARSAGASLVAYQPQISYGVTPTTDLILQPSWLSLREPGDTATSGLGDTNLDAKWRFFGEAPLSLAVRAGLTLPTSRRGLGLAQGEVAEHALLVGTVDAVPFTIHGNLGVVRLPGDSAQRQWIGQAAAALMWAASEQWIFTSELVATSNVLRSRRDGARSYLAGVIYTVRPGLDLDAGFQITRADPLARTLLLGVTYRFAP